MFDEEGITFITYVFPWSDQQSTSSEDNDASNDENTELL